MGPWGCAGQGVDALRDAGRERAGELGEGGRVPVGGARGREMRHGWVVLDAGLD